MRTHNHKKTIWRSIVSGFLAAALVLTTCAATFAPLSALADADTSKRFISQYDSLAQMYNAEAKINVEVAAEGMVLLKNRDNALPLSRSANVTLLGAASYNLYQGRNGTPGDGSAKVELADSLEAVGISVNPRVQALYAQVGEGKLMDLVASDGEVEFDGKSYVAASNGMLDDAINTFKFYDDAAIITLRRTGDEGADNLAYNVPGHSDPSDHNLMLTDAERETIAFAKQHFNKVIVLLNIPSMMEIGALKDDDAISAIVQISLPGSNGAAAIGKLLTGEANFSGRLIEFFMRDLKQDPTWYNFATYGQAYNTINGGNLFTDPDGMLDGTMAPRMGRGVTETYSDLEVALDYTEGLYFGYRYYETVAADLGEAGEEWYQAATVYPFGFGLSYTSFTQEITGVKGDLSNADGEITVEVKVTNTGAAAGKEVVQLYNTPPYTAGGIDKAAVNLVGFAKTEELKPGASQLVEVTFSVKELASFDYNDVNENENAGYELEEGEYILSIRADSHTVLDSTTLNCEQLLTWDEDGNPDTPNNIFSQEDGEWEQYNTLAYHWTESGEDHYLTRDMLVVDGEVYDLEQLAWLLDEDENEFTHEAFNVLKGRKASHAYEDYDNVLTDEIETDYENVWTKEMSDIPAEWTQGTGVIDPATGRYAIELYDLLGVDYDDAKWDELLNQLTLDEMISLVLDGGYHTQSVESIGKPYVEDKDGPAQIGMGGGDSSGWAWCGAPLIAQTWNVELSYEVGEAIGNETMLLGGVGWYGPGMNLHRNPLAGRNFEYYSQDALQGGLIGAAVVKGVVDMGGHVFVKHTFGNEQETSRQGVVTFMTEQALREVYAKPFEIAVKKGHANGLMSSFNLIGLQSSASYAINQQMYINEWGYRGFSVTDFWVNGNPMCGWPMGDLVRGGILPLNAMGSIGHNDYSDVGLEYSWDTDARDGKGMLKVPTYNDQTGRTNVENIPSDDPFAPAAVRVTDGTESATSYYWLRDMVKNILFITANSHYMRNGYAAYMLQGNTELSLKRGTAVAGTNLLSSDSLASLDQVFGRSGYTLTASGLPEGLNMNASGVLSGAPDEQGTFNVALRIAGNYGLNFIKGSSEINLTVGAFEEVPVENVTIEANTAMLGETYTGAISGSPIPEDAQWAEGVDGAYGKEYQQSDIGKYASKSYTVTGLPQGLTVNSDTGEITGTPTEAGEFVVTVTMTYQKVILVYTNGTIFVYGAGDPETYTGQYTFTVNGGFNVSFNTNGGAMISYVPTPSPYPGVNLPPKEVRTTKLNIGVEDGKTVTFGEIKSQVVEPVNGDSSFLGWATAADAFAPDVTDATVFDTEITLYAVWGSSN
jgi:beta-glucosidase